MPEPSSLPFTVRLLGPLEVYIRREPVPALRTRKGQWLLALLALRHGCPVDRDWLAGTLWPESPLDAGRANLRRSLTDLRRVLGAEASRLLSPSRLSLCLDLAGAEVDLIAFDAAIARGDARSLEQAIALYRGPLIEGCTEDWIVPERQRREAALLTALECLAARALKDGHPATAEEYLRRVVAIDPLRETAQRALMEALAAGGNHAAAVLVYRELRDLLHRELHAVPDDETRSLFARFQAEAARSRSADSREAPTRSSTRGEARSLRSGASSPSHNLPERLTSFVGREREIREIHRLLTSTRLLTVTGAGGCGKSRLALEAVRALPDQGEGVWLVELASLAEANLVPQAVAAVLGVRERPGELLTETLVAFLKPKCLLLLLDNCEHLLAACLQLSDTLLRRCPGVRILATSREALGILGETTYRIPPLTFPDTQAALPDPEQLLEYEAIRLFLDRAAAALPSFDLTPENAAAVASICRRLDGIPLAIEMAAPRLRALPVEALAARLSACCHLLTDGNRAALPRHQTLRAMIDWSHDLLSEPERVLLRRLSVFAGGWTLEAAEAVCSDCGFANSDFGLDPGQRPIQNPISEIQASDVLDRLTKLVDKSLVVYELRGGEGRYRLLELIRQFGGERLAASGESGELRRQHAQYYLRLAQTAAPHTVGPNQASWLDCLERELDNLRAVLSWATERRGARESREAMELGVRLAVAICRVWQVRGYVSEGRAWLARVLPLTEDDAVDRATELTTVCCRAYRVAGLLAGWQGDGDSCRKFHERSLQLARKAGDRGEIGWSLMDVGMEAFMRGQLEAAQRCHEEGLAILRELGDWETAAVFLEHLAWIAREQGQIERARSLAEESMRIYRESGDENARKNLIALIGTLHMLQGDYGAALACYEESREISQKVGIPECVGIALSLEGALARYQADLETARERYEQSIRIHHQIENWLQLRFCLIGLGCVVVMKGERATAEGAGAERWLARGVRLFGAAEALGETAGSLIWSFDRPDHERCVAAARGSLGEEPFAAAWAEGRAMSLETAAAYALGEGEVV